MQGRAFAPLSGSSLFLVRNGRGRPRGAKRGLGGVERNEAP
jgi:hypothetical protein